MSSIFELAGVPEPTTDDAKIRFIADQLRNAKRSPDDVPVAKSYFINLMTRDLCRKCNYIYAPIYLYSDFYMNIDIGECVLPPSKGSAHPVISDDVWDGTEFEGLYGGSEIPF